MRKRWLLLGFLTLLSVITYLDRVCIAFAGTRIQSELYISDAQWGWVLGVFSVSYGLFEIPSGALGDRFGQRKVLTRIVSWWSAFTILTGLVSSFPQLVITRFLFGAGEAGAYPNMSSAIGRSFPRSQRARAQGALWAASRLGGAVAPFLVVPVIVDWGWRAAFVVFGSVGIVWAIAWQCSYRDRRAEADTGQPFDTHGGAPWQLYFRSRQFWLILGMAWCYGWGASFYLSWLVGFLVNGKNLSDADVKRFSALPFLLGTFGNLLGGALSDRLARRYGLRMGRRLVGSISLALSAVLLLIAAGTDDKRTCVLAIGLAYGVMDCMLPSNWANCVDMAGRHAGAVSGAMNTAVQAGGFISIVLFGYLVQHTGSYDLPLQIIGVMVLLSAVLFSRIDPTRPLVVTPTQALLPQA